MIILKVHKIKKNYFQTKVYKLFITLFIFLPYPELFSQTHSAEQHYQKAIDFFNQDQPSEGFELLNKIIIQYPDYEEARYARSYYYIENDDYQKALVDCNYLLSKHPEEPEWLVFRGQVYFSLEMFAEAEQDYLHAFELDNKKLASTNALGNLYLWMSLYEDALIYFNQSLQNHPSDTSSLYYRAFTHFKLVDYSQAFLDISKYLTLTPDDLLAQRLKAMILIKQRKFNSAISVFEEIEKKDKITFEEEDFLYWGQAYYFLRKYEDAQFYFELPEEATNSQLYYYLGKTYYRLNQSEKSLPVFDKALSFTQDSMSAEIAPILYDRAIIYQRLRKNQQARQDFLRAIYLMPEIIQQKNQQGLPLPLLLDAQVYLKMDKEPLLIDSVLIRGYLRKAEQHIANGDSNRAIATCNKAIEIDSLNSYSYTVRATAYAMMNQIDKAWGDLSKANSLVKNRAKGQNLYLKALLYREQNKNDSALVALDKALETDAQKALLYREKAEIMYEEDKLDHAVEFMTQAIRLDSTILDFFNERASYYLANKAFEQVISDCNYVLTKDKTNMLALFNRGLALKSLKKYQDALDDFQIILLHYPDEIEIRALEEELLKKIKP